MQLSYPQGPEVEGIETPTSRVPEGPIDFGWRKVFIV
jgi:hypothetical protein